MKYVLATLKKEVSWDSGEEFASNLKGFEATFPCRNAGLPGLEREFIVKVPLDSRAIQIYIQVEESGLFENTEIIADKLAKDKTLNVQPMAAVSSKQLN